jgi:hypothetical protein
VDDFLRWLGTFDRGPNYILHPFDAPSADRTRANGSAYRGRWVDAKGYACGRVPVIWLFFQFPLTDPALICSFFPDT